MPLTIGLEVDAPIKRAEGKVIDSRRHFVTCHESVSKQNCLETTLKHATTQNRLLVLAIKQTGNISFYLLT